LIHPVILSLPCFVVVAVEGASISNFLITKGVASILVEGLASGLFLRLDRLEF
jgi:hypothetical protein